MLDFSNIFEKSLPRTNKTLCFETGRIRLNSLGHYVLNFSLRKIENCRYYEPLSDGSLKNPLSMDVRSSALPVSQNEETNGIPVK